MRAPRILSDLGPSARAEALLLVRDPELSPRTRQELSFRAAVLISCLALAGLAYASSQWAQVAFAGAARSGEVISFVISEGDPLEESPVEEEVRLESEELPPVVPAANPLRMIAAMAVPESLPELAISEEPSPLDLEEILISAVEPFPALVAQPEPVVRKKIASRPRSTPRLRERPSSSSTKKSARVMSRVPPTYPSSARRAGTEGRVTVLLTVGANGRVIDAKIASSSGSRALDRAALSAVRHWRFQPAMAGGKAVSSQVTAPVMFRLD